MIAAALPACTALQKQTPQQRAAAEAARSLLSRISATNENLQHFKGIGRIQLDTGSAAVINERVVWAAAMPSKLSVVVLASGLPVLKFASDGHYLYFVDMRDAQGAFHKFRSSDPQLDRLISIPVRSSDVVMLLAGRVPIREHSQAQLTTADSGSRVLVLEKWWRVVQKIHMDAQQDEVHLVEYFDDQQQPAFRVQFADRQAEALYRIPRQIQITGGSGARLRLHIERFIPNAETTPGMFVLKPPDRSASAAAE